MKNFFILVCFFFFGLVSAQNSVAAPAKCAIPSFNNEFKNSAAVFVGEVIRSSKSGDKRSFVFRVRHFWKGVNSREIEVSVFENMRYQAGYEDGKSYLVFARSNEDGTLSDGRCSRSAEIGGYSGSLKDDLQTLGEPKTCIDLKEENNDLEI